MKYIFGKSICIILNSLNYIHLLCSNTFIDTTKVVDVTTVPFLVQYVCKFNKLVASMPLSELQTPEEASATTEAGAGQIGERLIILLSLLDL